MIQQANLSVESQWQKELKQSFTRPEELLKFLKLPIETFSEDVKARQLFNMRVPRHFASLIEKQNPNDPLFLQVMPNQQEFIKKEGFHADPLQEHNAIIPGLLHKYKSRVLIMFRTGCAINCRYCFRREFPYGDNSVNKTKLLQALEYIKQNSAINEVILSGGDPLMADDDAIAWFIKECEKITQLTRIRIHTRLPVVIPNRITPQLLATLSDTRLKTIIVLHINHRYEISHELKHVCERISQLGITLLNQAVLLQKVNNSVDEQVKLSEALFSAGIMPYYLHLLDKVTGASHFDLTNEQVAEIYNGMLEELPGFLVPKLVREVGGEKSKTPILP